MKKKKKKRAVSTAQTLKKFQHAYPEASAEHDLLMNSYLQKNKDNHSHSDSLCLVAHKKKKKKKFSLKLLEYKTKVPHKNNKVTAINLALTSPNLPWN